MVQLAQAAGADLRFEQTDFKVQFEGVLKNLRSEIELHDLEHNGNMNLQDISRSPCILPPFLIKPPLPVMAVLFRLRNPQVSVFSRVNTEKE